MDRASLFTDHRISGRPIRAKYKHFRTIWEYTCDNSPTDFNSSSLQRGSSMHGVDTSKREKREKKGQKGTKRERKQGKKKRRDQGRDQGRDQQKKKGRDQGRDRRERHRDKKSGERQ